LLDAHPDNSRNRSLDKDSDGIIHAKNNFEVISQMSSFYQSLVDVRENLTQQVNLFKETEVIVVKK
jgi:hypothetical protein